MGVPLEVFATVPNVIAVTADDAKKASTALVTEVTTSTVLHTIADIMEVGYTGGKEVFNAPVFHVAEEALIDFAFLGRLIVLLVCYVIYLPGSHCFIDALT